MVKVKKLQTMDCVVGGFTYADDNQSVASLLLGLFDEDKNLRYVGGTMLTHEVGSRVLHQLESITQEPGFVRRKGGGRFISTFPDECTPTLPVVVVEVRYDSFHRWPFQTRNKLIRWRPDKHPEDCLLRRFNLSDYLCV
jgi:ATP-dependent DNA ligase